MLRSAVAGLILALALGLSESLAAQGINRMEFRDAPLRDILLALARSSGRSIVPDQTVSGNASFSFGQTDLKEALAAFLPSTGLYASEASGVITVSRIKLESDGEKLSVDAEAVPAPLLMAALARRAGLTLASDPLPDAALSLHCRDLPPSEAAALALSGIGGWRARQDGQALELRNMVSAGGRGSAGGWAGPFHREEDGSWSVDAPQARLSELAASLLDGEGREWALLMEGKAEVRGLAFSSRPFAEALSLLMERAGGDWAERDGIVYLFPLQRADLARSLRTNEIIRLRRVGAAEALSLLPAELSGSGLCRAERSANLVILSGSRSEIGPLRSFLEDLDRDLPGLKARVFTLSHLQAREAIALIPPRLCPIAPIAAPGGWSLVAWTDADGEALLKAFLSEVDRADPPLPLSLAHLRAEDLLANPPPSASKEELRASGRPDLVWYTGPASRRQAFLRDLAALDLPLPLLRYDILIVQTSARSGLEAGVDWTASMDGDDLAASGAQFGPEALPLGWALSASLGGLVNLGFDVVSALGAAFGARLQASLSESSSRVWADTSLTALAGQEARLQNTSTYRYVESGAVEGSPGVTREIASGIILSVTGSLSGSGEVVMSLNATISERAAGDAGAEASGPPETSERLVSAKFRVRPGQAIAITGLRLRKRQRIRSAAPILGSIPLLGLLFGSGTEREEESGMSIFILPRLVETDDGGSVKLAALWRAVRGREGL